MARLLALLVTLAVAVPVSAERDLALLMFDSPDCEFCSKWEAEVGVVYARTEEGRAAPLRRLPLAGPMPSGVELDEEIRYTPTFVLLRGEREVGRITGYPGEDHFWGLLGVMLAAQPVEAGRHIQP